MYKYNIIYYTYIIYIYISYLFIYNLFIDITAIDDLQAAPAESTMQPPCCAAVQLCSCAAQVLEVAFCTPKRQRHTLLAPDLQATASAEDSLNMSQSWQIW